MIHKPTYAQGQTDFQRGAVTADNPYQPGTSEAFCWLAGLMDAYQAAWSQRANEAAAANDATTARAAYYLACISGLKKQQAQDAAQATDGLSHSPHRTLQ